MIKEPLTIESMWNAYDAVVIPSRALEVQRKECKFAFYAGAHTVLSILVQIGDAKITEDQSRKILNQLLTELEAFEKNRKA